MPLITPECTFCKKKIDSKEDALVVVPYPKRKGFTEIKAFLHLEGKFICNNCKDQLNVNI